MSRDITLDRLRALAILYVVAFAHMLTRSKVLPSFQHSPGSVRMTLVALGLFVFLSGYLVGSKERFADGRDVGRYYIRRVLRIYPLFLLAIGLFWALRIDNPVKLIKAMLLVSMFMKPVALTLYFVALLMLYYLVAPLLVRTRHDPARYLGVCAVLTILMVAYWHFGGALDRRLLLYFPSFALGVWLGGRKLPESWFAAGVVCVAAAGSAWLSFASVQSPILEQFVRMPLALTAPVGLLLVMRKAEGIRIGVKATALVSYCSFSLYLFHRPVLVTMKRIWFPQDSALQAVYLFLVFVPLAIAIAWGIQKGYDYGIHRWVRWMRRRQTVSTDGSCVTRGS